METRFIEATQDTHGTLVNWGKFMLARFSSDEWRMPSALDQRALVRSRGWSRSDIFVMDLQTGEGALFSPGGSAHADLQKRQIWVCPLFEPFLAWLYQQDLTDITELPPLVELRDAPFEQFGHRRPGIR